MDTVLALPISQRKQDSVLRVTARRCPQDLSRFRWTIREAGGLLIAQAVMSFASEAEAFRAGNAVARAIRQRWA